MAIKERELEGERKKANLNTVLCYTVIMGGGINRKLPKLPKCC